MQKLSQLKPESVFKYFEEITSIPRGSGDMEKISSYCEEFAKKNSLKYIRDVANNIIIFKDGTKGYENSEPVILQGHLDMVCQKEEGVDIDFEKEGLDIYVDGNFIKARGTTLGADNGIAVAMILSVLERNDISHPPIEAVFTTDEETGMFGAKGLSFDKLKSKKMINIDSEDDKVLTVSCAGGSDFVMTFDFVRKSVVNEKITISIEGLKGGHSGVEINSHRQNANFLAGRILNFAKEKCDFDIISIDGGEKGNAIPDFCKINLLTNDAEKIVNIINDYVKIIKSEIINSEPDFKVNITKEGKNTFDVLDDKTKENLLFLLFLAPNGVVSMSDKIEGLVETSLNLGILKTEDEKIIAHFTLRSNKESAMAFLEQKLFTLSKKINAKCESFGHYPAWEFKENSSLQNLYQNLYKEKFNKDIKVEAIHAGLECGIFASKIKNFDCISIGPEMYDIHTPKERVSISSTKEIYELVLKVLEELK
ncbi:MAG: aminoacyl-histidine dipeptidase [Ruminococcaceae bacterium]|nr:aminoacyl-histidine dipeptidase [Oscillospiraceae bacterium]